MNEERSQRQLRLDSMGYGHGDNDDENGLGLEELIFHESLKKEYRSRKKTETPKEVLIPFYRVDYSSNRK